MLKPLVFFALLAAIPPAVTAQTEPTLTLSPCRLEGLGGLGSLRAECGRLSVAEDPNTPEGARVELFVARLAALKPKPDPSAFTVIAGGPGQASTQFFVSARGAFEGIRRDHDIIVVDQRGTGKSNAMNCEIPETDVLNADAERAVELTRECLAELPGDPRFYTTSVAVRDLDAVRAALAYEQLDVYGVSYGTRVALHYLRRYPERTRSVIIDGVVPADYSLGPDIALQAQRAVDDIFASCAADVACNVAFGDLAGHFAALSARLDEAPVTLNLPDPLTGQFNDVEFNGLALMSSVRLLAYSPPSIALLPLMLHEAAVNENFLPLATQYQTQVVGLSEALSLGMHNAVVCAEDAPFFSVDETERAKLAGTFIGVTQVDALRDTCEIWPRGVMDEDFKTPVSSDKPVLLLSGSLDPITPPAYAEQARKTLSNAKHLVGNGQGHGLAGVGCVPRLMAKFVDSLDPLGLDATCLEVQAASPFFTSFVGTEP